MVLVLAAGVLSLGRASVPAHAGVADYTSSLYLSGAASTNTTMEADGAYTLVNSPGVSTTARPTPAVPAISCNSCGGNLTGNLANWRYRYTLVDANGETAPSNANAGTGSITAGEISVDGLPTGVTVRLYRTPAAGSTNNGPWYLVAELPNNSSSTYVDNIPDASLGALLPQSQNRTAGSATGYYEYAPGTAVTNPNIATGDFAKVAAPSYDGHGWFVDAAGGVSFPAGTWQVTVKLTSLATTGTGALDIGLWIVDDSGSVVGNPLVDPSCTSSCSNGAQPGENSSANIARASGTGSPITTSFSLPAIKLDRNQHLYVQFWRHQTVGSLTNTLSTLNTYDGTAQITYPTPNGYPDLPTLGSVASRVRTTPSLSATYTDPDADSGTMEFQLRNDSASSCGSAGSLDGFTSGTLANNGTANWTPTATLVDGTTYTWCVQSTDANGNLSGWSSGSFVYDTTPPSAPTPTSPSAAQRVNSTQLSATFNDPSAGDSGTVTFQLCSDAACSSVIGTSTSSTVTDGTSVSWTPTGLADGTYWWRLLSTDIAGNATSPTTAQKFILDTNPPATPTPNSPADGVYVGSAPSLNATFSSNDTGDSGTLTFRVCQDSGCSTVLGTGTAGVATSHGSGSWTASGMGQGVNYWEVQAQDAAGNTSAWSAARSFTYDTVGPADPYVGSPTTRVKTPPLLSGTYADPGGYAGDAGTLLFQLCPDAGCSSVSYSDTAANVANGSTPTWTPATLADGLYYVRITATDTAGNSTVSATTPSFTMDTQAPSPPPLVSPAGASRTNNTTPSLTATFTDLPAGGTGTLSFQLCSDASCATVLLSGTAGGEANVCIGSWSARSLSDG